MAHDQQTYRRGVASAVIGLSVQLVLAVVMLMAGFWIENTGWAPGVIALYALTWHLFAGLPIWVILIIAFNEHRRERVESLEAEQLSRTDADAAALFEEHEDELNLARRRLKNVYRWGVNAVALLVAAFLITVGFILLASARAMFAAETPQAMPQEVNTAVLIVLSAAAAFIAFMVARYHAGMTKVKEWQLLRGGAGFLMGGAVVAMLLLIASVAAYFGAAAPFRIVAAVAPVMLLLLGFEIVVSFFMGFYRPRRPGEMPRPAFDGRLTGWLTSPKSIAEIVRETIEYQFGWEVSRSWFYQLLNKSMTWLIAFGALMLIAISSVVVVGPEEEAIITTFGRISGQGESAVKGPGLHLKWPWPIGEAHRVPTQQVRELAVGSINQRIAHDQAVLWGSAHGDEEYLITAPSTALQRQEDAQSDAPGMALIGAEIVVQYRIRNLLEYFQGTRNQPQMLRALAERQVNAYFVSHDIDMLLARGRVDAGAELRHRIQQAADDQTLGVDILFVGLTGVHPPTKETVAKAFLEQIGALQEREARIEQARQAATEIYTKAAGSREQAFEIHELIQEYDRRSTELDQLRRQAEADAAKQKELEEAKDATERRIIALIAASRGAGADAIYAARAQRWQRVNAERARRLRYEAEFVAWRNAPTYYSTKLYLDVLAKGLAPLRKYILASKQARPATIDIDLKQEAEGIRGLFEDEQ